MADTVVTGVSKKMLGRVSVSGLGTRYREHPFSCFLFFLSSSLCQHQRNAYHFLTTLG